MLTELNEILAYKNTALLKRYHSSFPASKLSPEDALKELSKYFWLAKKHQLEQSEAKEDANLDFVCSIYPEMTEIDNMWHTFLLFTRDYADYCNKYFGAFIDHVPEDNNSLRPDSDNIRFERYLSYIYDNLGEETLKIWFSKYFEDNAI